MLLGAVRLHALAVSLFLPLMHHTSEARTEGGTLELTSASATPLSFLGKLGLTNSSLGSLGSPQH